MDCEYCKKSFSTLSSLNYHKKTAKFCLDIQGKVNDTCKCIYCGKICTTNQNVIEHHKICKKKKENEQKEIEKKLKRKKERKKM